MAIQKIKVKNFKCFKNQALDQLRGPKKVIQLVMTMKNKYAYRSRISEATLQGIIRGRVDLESVIHSDGWRGYDGLVDLGYQKHFRVQHSHNEFANKHSHINEIESFWGFAKTRLIRFRGLSKHTFYFHLKECEFRFNHRQENIYLLMLKMLR